MHRAGPLEVESYNMLTGKLQEFLPLFYGNLLICMFINKIWRDAMGCANLCVANVPVHSLFLERRPALTGDEKRTVALCAAPPKPLQNPSGKWWCLSSVGGVMVSKRCVGLG